MPKVSIIIPNYNHAPYLEKRIKSVLNQTFQDFEVIFLDDASPDNSREVFSQFESDPRIRAIFNETNSGSVFKQWNKGFKEATGEYIWIAESDDYADERLLETLVQNLDQNPTAGVAYCQSWVVDENDKQIRLADTSHDTPACDNQSGCSFRKGMDEVTTHFIYGTPILNASAALFRRDIIEKIGYADETLRLAGDWHFWARILLVSDLVYVSQPMNYWRTHSGTVRSSTLRNGIMVMEAYKVFAAITKAADLDAAVLEKARARRFRFWMCYNEDVRFGFARNREIYRLAKQLDPTINRRLLAYIPVAPFRMVLRPLKNWLSGLVR